MTDTVPPEGDIRDVRYCECHGYYWTKYMVSDKEVRARGTKHRDKFSDEDLIPIFSFSIEEWEAMKRV